VRQQEEREWRDARWAAVREGIGAGDFDDLAAPKVSVVIPCFNQGEFVVAALLSVFEQTMADFEIVIVDDGSDDGTTPEVLDSLDLPRITVIHQDNVGLPGARNRGIAAARGEYVVMLDADDELGLEYLEKLSALLDADQSSAFAHCWALVFGDYEAVWATRPFNRYQILLSNSVVGCVMLRKSAWEAVGGYDESMLDGNEDWDLWIRLTEAGFGNRQIRESLFRYRKHGVTMSVQTEARYEAALAALTLRLSEVYSIDHLRELKRDAYPLLSILTDDEFLVEPFDDVQIIRISYDRIDSIIDEVRGKFVVWWPSTTDASTEVLTALCKILEDDAALGAVETSADTPIRVVRAWSLHDAHAPTVTEKTGFDGSADRSLAFSQFPDAAWQVPKQIGEIRVNRQSPEEAGRIPAWASR